MTSGSVSPQGGPLRGEVVSVVTSGNAAIGANQVVLSGEGDKATALQQYTVGDEIEMYFRFTDENWNKVDFAIGGNYVIVENGQAKTYAYGSSAGAFTAAAQRTAFGIRADGTVVLVATNGRGSGGVGFTANDMSRLMAEDYGCQYAILLDGGGSTTLVTQTSSGSYQVRNTLASSQRAVGNGIFIARLSTPRAVPWCQHAAGHDRGGPDGGRECLRRLPGRPAGAHLHGRRRYGGIHGQPYLQRTGSCRIYFSISAPLSITTWPLILSMRTPADRPWPDRET